MQCWERAGLELPSDPVLMGTGKGLVAVGWKLEMTFSALAEKLRLLEKKVSPKASSNPFSFHNFPLLRSDTGAESVAES